MTSPARVRALNRRRQARYRARNRDRLNAERRARVPPRGLAAARAPYRRPASRDQRPPSRPSPLPAVPPGWPLSGLHGCSPTLAAPAGPVAVVRGLPPPRRIPGWPASSTARPARPPVPARPRPPAAAPVAAAPRAVYRAVAVPLPPPPSARPEPSRRRPAPGWDELVQFVRQGGGVPPAVVVARWERLYGPPPRRLRALLGRA